MNAEKTRFRWLAKTLRAFLYAGLAGALFATGAGVAVWFYLEPRLPSIDVLKDVRLQVPLRVYSRDQRLIAEFGEKRRIPVRFAEVPDLLVMAVLAAEDDRFFQHPGVDWQGITRAAWHLLRTGEKGQGGSTITMQVARNFFLGREKTYLRKVNEIILALKIEQELSKQEILELYLNKIYLGRRAYGVGAAAQVYYGKPLAELDLAQLAMIAGLPKAPSRFNPIADPVRGVARRNYVLRRLKELGYIDQETYRAAHDAPVTAKAHGLAKELEAPYLAEMVRAQMVERYGQDAYTGGFTVYTTVDCRLQKSGNRALRDALLAYDQRHGYRGPERHVPLTESDGPARWDEILSSVGPVGGLRAALIVDVQERSATAYRSDVGEMDIPWEGLEWARRYLDENRLGPELETAGEALSPGDIVRVRQSPEGNWKLVQIPEVEGALVALAPDDGAILALTGGLDFYRSKFNRVTQAQRQPGSNFKPFIYSAAVNAGFTAASIINDAPVVFDDAGLEAAWRPENYSGRFYGPTRMRVALSKSRNLVSIRLLRSVGIDTTIDYLQRFGFEPGRLPRDLSLALGSGSLTPLELARGYGVFANGGYLIEPFFIERIVGLSGDDIFQARPLRVCEECLEVAAELAVEQPDRPNLPGEEPLPEPDESPAPRVIEAQNVWLMTSMMRDVILRGTGRRALSLKRGDLAGKTGTTNDQRDTWFSGFNRQVAATVWVGFDRLRPMGNRETGAKAALPMWIDFMRVALADLPEVPLERPKGLVTVRIDPDTGLRAAANNPKAVFETFRVENVPRQAAVAEATGARVDAAASDSVTEQLF
ncbi:MAG: penicillin-binding protein 1A [Gammaproteobacteria bacterium]|nr:penicillin-binding protein 1A [Gammaproteobacteria bacterium]